MGTQEKPEHPSRPIELTSSPRISFSLDLVGDVYSREPAMVEGDKMRDPDFEFLSGNGGSGMAMLPADELFFEGRLLPFWQTQSVKKLEKITVTAKEEVRKEMCCEANGVSWFVDDDPSPRPPKCAVLWKELLRLRKQQPTTTHAHSLVGTCGKGEKSEARTGEKHAKRVTKGLERTRSARVRLRPVVHVPICTHVKNNAFPMLFALKRE